MPGRPKITRDLPGQSMAGRCSDDANDRSRRINNEQTKTRNHTGNDSFPNRKLSFQTSFNYEYHDQ
jgi:hypothetical protein